VVVVLGVPLVLAYVAARILPGILWFDEVGQGAVYSRVIEAKVEFAVVVTLVATLVVGANLALALRRTDAVRTNAGVLGITAAALVTGSMFGSSAVRHWQTYLLWRHRPKVRAALAVAPRSTRTGSSRLVAPAGPGAPESAR
jgi:hypothetical protein